MTFPDHFPSKGAAYWNGFMAGAGVALFIAIFLAAVFL